MKRLVPFAGIVAALTAAGALGAPEPRSANEALYQAFQLLNAGLASEAREAFDRANALAGGKCFTCLEGAAAAELRRGNTKAAVAASRRAIGVAGKGEETARGENQLGLALAADAGDDRKRLTEAEAAYRRALDASGGKLNAASYNLAGVLLRQGRKEEGLAELTGFLSREPSGGRAAQARTLARSPHRAGEVLAPDFSLDTLSGGKVTLAGLAGKVVLLDFWATWCGPCRLALPELQDLKKQMVREPFEIVSASADRDLATLRDFVAKNAMTWPQFWDSRGELARDFSVPAYPSYYLIDHDGVIVYSMRGWSPAVGVEIAAEVRKAVKKAKGNPRATRPAAGG